MNSKYLMVSVLALVATWTAPAIAQAQTAAAEAPQAGLEDIVVTARKSEEKLQRAAISLTALAGDDLKTKGITSPTELETLVPGVTFQTTGSLFFANVRGVGTYNSSPGVDSAIAYSIDGIYVSHQPAAPRLLFDLARVEAVRGPQGTLFGRNSNGGGVAFISNRPVDRFEASASATLGNYEQFGTEAMLNVPIATGVAARLAFASNKHDSYTNNGLNDGDDWAVRGRLLLQPTSNFEIILSGDYTRSHAAGEYPANCPPNSTIPQCASIPWDPYSGFGNPFQPDNKAIVDSRAVYMEANLDLDWAVITSLTAYRYYRFNSVTVAQTGAFAYSQDDKDKFFTQELRIASPAGSPVKWVLGGFYSNENLDSSILYDFGGVPTLFTPAPDVTAKSKAVFGQLTFPLVADVFSITGGLRYTDEKKGFFGRSQLLAPNGSVVVDVPLGDRTQEDRLTYKVGVDWNVTPQNLLYALVSNGFKSGGVNSVPVGVRLPRTYSPETITAYQVGTKNRFLDNRLQINAEAFWYDYKGFQAFSSVQDPDGALPGIFFLAVNSQKSTFYGVDAEITAALSPVDRLSVTGSLLHARFDQFVIPIVGTNFSGNKVNSAPPWSLGANYSHVFAFDNGANLEFQLDSKLTAGHYTNLNNAPGSYQDTYSRTSATLTFNSASDNWSVTAFVKNIEGKAIISAWTTPFDLPYDQAYVMPPRTVGVTFRAKIN